MTKKMITVRKTSLLGVNELFKQISIGPYRKQLITNVSGIRPIVLPERFFGLTSHSINTTAHYAETTELLTAACKHTIAN